MTTIQQLTDDIRALKKKVDGWESQVLVLFNEKSDGTNTEHNQLMIKYFGDRISEVNSQILLAVVWYAVTTYAGAYFDWSWSDNFKTTYPNLSDCLYLLIQHIFYDMPEHLVHLEFIQWLGNVTASPVGGNDGARQPLLHST